MTQTRVVKSHSSQNMRTSLRVSASSKGGVLVSMKDPFSDPPRHWKSWIIKSTFLYPIRPLKIVHQSPQEGILKPIEGVGRNSHFPLASKMEPHCQRSVPVFWAGVNTGLWWATWTGRVVRIWWQSPSLSLIFPPPLYWACSSPPSTLPPPLSANSMPSLHLEITFHQLVLEEHWTEVV